MKCGLCLQEKDLCRSHIIPEFMYSGMYDDKGRMSMLSTKPGEKIRYRQKGAYEPLLCSECEGMLSKHEHYSRKVLFAKDGRIEVTKYPNGVGLKGINYERFRLFLLSILWRASVAADVFFEGIHLPSQIEETLRSMIMKSDAGEPEDFGCVFCINRQLEHITGDAVFYPYTLAREGYVVCRFIMLGLFWNFFVPRAPDIMLQEELILSKDGVMAIAFEEKHSSEIIRNFAIHWARSGSLPLGKPQEP